MDQTWIMVDYKWINLDHHGSPRIVPHIKYTSRMNMLHSPSLKTVDVLIDELDFVHHRTP